jgi:hypothetical protein
LYQKRTLSEFLENFGHILQNILVALVNRDKNGHIQKMKYDKVSPKYTTTTAALFSRGGLIKISFCALEAWHSGHRVRLHNRRIPGSNPARV